MERTTGILNVDNVALRGRAQIEVDCELISDDGILSVLGVSADAVALTAESFETDATVTGRVNFKVLYVSSENGLSAMDYYSDFKTSISTDSGAVHKLFAFGKVLGVEKINVTENAVKLKAIVEIELIGANKKEIAHVDCAGVCAKREVVSECELKEVAEGAFDIYEEYDTEGSVEKIILLDTDLILKDGKPTRDGLLISGTAVANLVYKTQDGVKSLTLSLPFCEEIETLGATPDDDIYLYGYVKDSKIILSGDEDNTVIRVDMTVSVRVPVFEVREKEILVDAYDIDNDIRLDKRDCESYKKTGDWNWEERLSGTVSLEEDRAVKILALCNASPFVSEIKADKDKISLLGALSALLVYVDEDDIIKSVDVELPFAVDYEAQGSEENGETYLRTAICDTTTAIKRGGDVEVMYVLKVYAYQCVREKFSYVSDIAVEECASYERKPIVIYKRRDGENDWDIAKALRVPIESVLDRGEKLVVCYRQLEE